jgi:hypothetical protein
MIGKTGNHAASDADFAYGPDGHHVKRIDGAELARSRIRYNWQGPESGPRLVARIGMAFPSDTHLASLSRQDEFQQAANPIADPNFMSLANTPVGLRVQLTNPIHRCRCHMPLHTGPKTPLP